MFGALAKLVDANLESQAHTQHPLSQRLCQPLCSLHMQAPLGILFLLFVSRSLRPL